MSVNLLELVQVKMAYPVLQKIDANTQEVIIDEDTPDENRFSQSALTSILTGLYVFSRKDENAEKILQKNDADSWVSTIFGSFGKEIVEKVASYSFYTSGNAEKNMNLIAECAVEIIKENLPGESTMGDIKDFLTAQRNIILSYLPAALQIGALLNDNTMDDRTHKMEGPISGLMHSIGDSFSDGEVTKNE